MNSFQEFGVTPDLVATLDAAGYEAPTAIQRAAYSVLRRGGSAVLHAAQGAGLTAAYGVPLLERAAEAGTGQGPRVLIVAPTSLRADAIARTLSELARMTTVTVRALSSGWQNPSAADVVVAHAETAAEAVRASELKLEGLQSLVIESVTAQLAASAEALDAVLTAVPRDAQRVITAARGGAELDRFIEAYVRKPMHIPARPSDAVRPQVAAQPVGYILVDAGDKDDVLSRLLTRTSGERGTVTTRTTARADALRERLRARGHRVGAADTTTSEAEVIVRVDDAGVRDDRVIAYDVPADAELLAAAHSGAGVILVQPVELAHLRQIASAAGLELRAEVTRPTQRPGADFHDEVRRALRERDIEAQLLVLEPLFGEYPAAEVAAALSALLRDRRNIPAAAEPAVGRVVASAPAGAAPATWARLFVSVGTRDNVRAGDLVGAITGEANIAGDQVGKIELRDTFSVVEVAADVAEKVIRALNGTTMKSRSLRVDYDRKPTGRTAGAREGGGRESKGRPPREREGSERPKRRPTPRRED